MNDAFDSCSSFKSTFINATHEQGEVKEEEEEEQQQQQQRKQLLNTQKEKGDDEEIHASNQQDIPIPPLPDSFQQLEIEDIIDDIWRSFLLGGKLGIPNVSYQGFAVLEDVGHFLFILNVNEDGTLTIPGDSLFDIFVHEKYPKGSAKHIQMKPHTFWKFVSESTNSYIVPALAQAINQFVEKMPGSLTIKGHKATKAYVSVGHPYQYYVPTKRCFLPENLLSEPEGQSRIAEYIKENSVPHQKFETDYLVVTIDTEGKNRYSVDLNALSMGVNQQTNPDKPPYCIQSIEQVLENDLVDERRLLDRSVLPEEIKNRALYGDDVIFGGRGINEYLTFSSHVLPCNFVRALQHDEKKNPKDPLWASETSRQFLLDEKERQLRAEKSNQSNSVSTPSLSSEKNRSSEKTVQKNDRGIDDFVISWIQSYMDLFWLFLKLTGRSG